MLLKKDEDAPNLQFLSSSFRLLGLNNRSLLSSDLTESIITSFMIFNCHFSSPFSPSLPP